MNPHGMSDDEFLDCLGPAWSEMSEAERASYPRPPERGTQRPTPTLPPSIDRAAERRARILARQAADPNPLRLI